MLLAMTMVVACLAGCGKSEEKTTPETKSSTESSAVTSTAEGELTLAQQAIADRKAEAEKTGKYTKVVVSLTGQAHLQVSTESTGS